jgi:endonuclease G
MRTESLSRLESMRALSPGKFRAAAKAVSEGRIDPARFGATKRQLLDAIEGRPTALESIGVAAPALEAIVKLTGRPPLLVQNNTVVLEPLDDFPADTGAKIKAVEPLLPSVGRVEFINHSMAWGGTAWVVGKREGGHLAVTNRHVAKLVAKRTTDGRAVFMRSPVTGVKYGAQVDFNEEVEATPQDARVVQVVEIVYLADDVGADIALLKVKKADDDGWLMPDPIPLADREAVDQELVALIGYPAYDSRNDANAMDRYFRDLYDVKRFAPGRIIRMSAGSVLGHDCTSLGGNSGSSLLSLEQKAAVGLHFAGVYGISNSAVGVGTIKRLLTGSLAPIAAKIESSAGAEAAADCVHSPAELADRDGFDPDFLGEGLSVSWPRLPAALERDLASPADANADRPHELRYTHFSVKFSTAFKLPVLTAVNIDGANSMHIKRTGDKWFFDGRIDRKLQHGQKAYQDENIDRGHMVRREDPNWGEDARQADRDTFHYTNTAPQHSLLNQGKQFWQGLENYILDSARTHGFKACVFTAPVFSDEDPTLEEEDVRVPLEFWKVVVMEDSGRGKLHATAYLLSQGQLIRKLLEDRNRPEAVEGFVLGPYRTFHIAIADLETATGYDFGPFKDADPLTRTQAGPEAAIDRAPIVVPLENFQDMVL